MKKSNNQNREILLKGEGVNQHTLYGDFRRDEDSIVVDNECRLKHETPSGKFAEHNTLLVQRGTWILGRQVEYNPLDKKVQRVWD